MLEFVELTTDSEQVYTTLTLPLEQRTRSRLRVTLDNNEDAGLFLPRGIVLQHGDFLQAKSGEMVEIIAASESVSTLYIDDPVLMARASYHLGNRHVPLQINNEFIRYQHDHVLDDMVRGLGIEVVAEQAPFEPEPGAYGGGHGHAHDHDHHHGHSHAH